MSAKSEKEPVALVEDAECVDGALLNGGISDDELNMLIARAVEDAELSLAGTPVVGASEYSDILELIEDENGLVH